MTGPLRVLSLCSGAVDGLGLAAEAAGMEIAALCEIDPWCRQALAHHFPERMIYHDVRDVTRDRLRRDGVGPIDVLVAGPPCFAAGTLILTWRGYQPIEDVHSGDVVLTHLGRWKPVTAVMRRDDAVLRTVKAVGTPAITTTDDHPFLGRPSARHWDNVRRRYVRAWGVGQWVEASQLSTSWYLGQTLPQATQSEGDCAYWWMVGRYLADGWRARRAGRRGGRVIICASKAEADVVEGRIREAGYAPTRVTERTTVKFHIQNNALYDRLEDFGRHAHGKLLPGYVFMVDRDHARALLDGYISGDGYSRATDTFIEHSVTTTSKALALSVALLAQRAYGTVASVHLAPLPPRTLIEGREVNQRHQWKVRVYDTNRLAFVEGQYGWKQVRRSEPAGRGPVYNLAVGDDESYIADGAIVHNCQDVSHAGRRRGAQGDRWLWPEVLGVVGDLEPRWVCFENPLGLRTVGARREFGALLATLATLGYRVGYDQWGAADVGAPHQRERVFIIACRATRAVGDADGLVDGRAGHDPTGGVGQEAAGPPGAGPDTLRRSVACAGDPGAPAGAGAAGPLADAQSARRPLRRERGGGPPTESRPERHGDPDNATAERAAQPGVGLPADGPAAGLVRFPGWPAPPGEAQRAYEPPRLTTGVKGRPKMLHALGNSVLWRQAYPIFCTIVEVEEGAVTPWTP